MGEELFFIRPPFGVVFLWVTGMKPKPDVTEYLDDFDVPPEWEPLRDEDGEVMEGCYRTLPAPDSDNL